MSLTKKSKLKRKLEKMKQQKKPKYNILAFDIATRTGFCSDLEHHGFFDNKTRKDESNGFRLIRFESKVEELIKMVKPNVIAFERVSGHRVQAVKVQSGFQAILERLCLKSGIDYTAKSATEIKKFMTGKGNSGKSVMIKSVNEVLNSNGFDSITDDNEADALALWMMVSNEFNNTRYGENSF